jgi:hypothetical protein
LGVLLDDGLVHMNAKGIFGIQKRVQMSSRHMSFRVKLEEAQLSIGPNLRAEKWNVIVVAIKNAAHGSTAEFHSGSNVRGIHIFYALGKVW